MNYKKNSLLISIMIFISSAISKPSNSLLNSTDEYTVVNADSNMTLLLEWEDEIVKNTMGINIKNKNLYLLNKNDGLYVLDVTDPSEPNLKGSYTLPNFSRCMTIDSNHVYVGNDGIHIIDIRDPSSPVEVGYLDTNGGIETDISVQGNYVYITNKDNHLYIVDISNKSNPQLKGQYDAGDDLTAVAVQGRYAYVGVDEYLSDRVEREFRVIDVNDPENPIEVGKYDGWWGRSSIPAGGNRPIKSMVASNSYLYVINHYMGLGIFDIRDPQNPTEAGFYHGYRGSIYDLSLIGNHVYVSDYDCQMIDISSPSAPQLIGYHTLDYDHYYSPINTAEDGLVFIAAEKLFIIQDNLTTDIEETIDHKPRKFVLEQNYPNPFNPVTTIQFFLKKDSQIQLNVYNTIGQKVATLVNEFYHAGLYKVNFDGSHLPSGIYIYKMQTKSFSESRKMMLMR